MLFFLNDNFCGPEVMEFRDVVTMIITAVLPVLFNDGNKWMKPIPAVKDLKPVDGIMVNNGFIVFDSVNGIVE